MQPLMVKASEQFMNLVMHEDAQELQEVVVTGMQKMDKQSVYLAASTPFEKAKR